EAGVRTIEHGSYLDEEAAAAMKETGTILVPTRWIVEHLAAVGRAQGMPEYAAAKLDAIVQRHAEAVATAISAGATMACGTAVWGAGTWRRNADECAYLEQLGMTLLEAIRVAPAAGPLPRGPHAPRSWVLAAGYGADLLPVAGDPTTDIRVLAD